MDEIILEVSGLSKQYGPLQAVSSLDFSIKKGSVFGILGPNGSGKTTTLGMLVDAINPTSGSFSWFGQSQNTNQRHRIGTLLEKPNFYDYLSATDNLKIIAEIRGAGHNQIEEVLKDINLWDRRNSKFKTFSLGMKQRLAIGSVLLGDPEVLILDEPTNGLDPYGIAEVRTLIKETAAKGKTILLASHLLDEVQKVCSHVLVMKKGKKIFFDKVSSINTADHSFVLNANNQAKLIELLKNHPQCSKVEKQEEKVCANFSDGITPEIINTYLMENGVVLNYLTASVFNLEKQILSLLDHSA